MKNCVFTICAKNYIGLAQVLERSVKTFNGDIDFYTFIADEVSPEENIRIPDHCVISKDVLRDYVSEKKWKEMAFKYNLTEFCTSIKAYCFKYLFEKEGYDKVLYLDPDIYVFSSLEIIFTHLSEYKILLTPHITSCRTKYTGERSESGLLSTGMYNLGFLALRRSDEVDAMLNWWGSRLENHCFVDVIDNYFTDQRWMDFVPCFFDSKTLLILRDPGFNLAPWNFFEREIYSLDDNLYVTRRNSVSADLEAARSLLCFVHFSGFNYLEVIDGDFSKNPISGLDGYPDLRIVFESYSESLLLSKDNFVRYLELPYSYNSFDNGVVITHFHRRIFRSLLEENEEIVEDPFSSGPQSFYVKLMAKGLLNPKEQGDITRVKRSGIAGLDGMLKGINRVVRILVKIMGLRRYILLLRLMRPYSRIENQLFLYDKRYNKLK